MSGLMLHCGANHATWQDVLDVRTPAGTSTWSPISHQWLVGTVTAELSRSGYLISDDQHALWHDGSRYFGLMELKRADKPTGVRSGFADDPEPEGDADHSLVIGVRNSHDKKFAAGIAVGGRVFVCDNLSFSAEVVLTRKHTPGISTAMNGMVRRAIGRIDEEHSRQVKRFREYKGSVVADATAHDFMVRSVKEGVLSMSKLSHVLKDWEKPPHESFLGAEHQRTAWTLWNAYTGALKGYSVIDLPSKTQKLHLMMDQLCSRRVAGEFFSVAT